MNLSPPQPEENKEIHMIKFPKDIIEREESNSKFNYGMWMVTTGSASFFGRRYIKNKLKDYNMSDHDATALSYVTASGLSAAVWGVYKAIETGTINGTLAGMVTGIICSTLGVLAGEGVCCLADNIPNPKNIVTNIGSCLKKTFGL